MAVVDLTASTESFPGLDAKVFFDEFHFSSQIEDFKHSKEAKTFEGSGLGTETENTHVGIRKGDMDIKAFASMSEGKFGDVLNQRFGRTRPVNISYATEGLAVGKPMTFQPSRISNSSISFTNDEVCKMEAKAVAAGAMHDGYILLSPETLLSGASGSGAVHNNTPGGGASTYGGAVMLHLLALDGGTTPTVEITWEHSATSGGTYAELTSMTVDALGAWYFKIPSVTAINPFVRASYVVTGTPTAVQVAAAYARGYSRSG